MLESDKLRSELNAPPPVKAPEVLTRRLVGTAPIDEGVIVALEADEIRPYASTVITGACDVEPYEPAETPVVVIEIVPEVVIGPPVRPAPVATLVTVPAPVPCALTKAVVAIVVELSDVKGVGAVGTPVNAEIGRAHV